MTIVNCTGSNADSMRVLRAKLLMSQSYAATLEFENASLAQQMQEIELQEISAVRHELVDLANRLNAWGRIQEEALRQEKQLLGKLQTSEEELRMARAYSEESDRKYVELLSYAKENLNQVEKEKAILRRKLAQERRKNNTDERAILTQIILESGDASILEIEDDTSEVEAIAPFLSSHSIEQSTQMDDPIVEQNVDDEILCRNNSSDGSALSRQSSSIERNDSMTAEEAQRRPWHKDVSSNQTTHRHIQNQLSRQACELKALRKERVLLQSQLDHCRWLLWDLEEYRNWNRQKSPIHRHHEPFQPLNSAEDTVDLVWQKKVQYFDTLTRVLMKEVDRKNAVISEMSTVCTPMEALSCVHREQERSLKMAAVTSVALAESQMKVDELTAALQRLDMSQRSGGGIRSSNGSTNKDPAKKKNSSDSEIGRARMDASSKAKSEPFLLTDQNGAPGMLMDFKGLGTNHHLSSDTTNTTRERHQPAMLRGPSRNKVITEDPNGINFNSKIQSLFRSSAIDWAEKPTDSTTKGLETTIRALQERIAILEQENNAFYVTSRVKIQ
jgi:hypothetical protein